MTQSRLAFKKALKDCRKRNEQIVDDKIAMNINRDSKKALVEINRKKNSKTPIPNVIESATGSEEISNFWRDHYSNLFNDMTHSHPSILPRYVAADAPTITVNEVKKCY